MARSIRVRKGMNKYYYLVSSLPYLKFDSPEFFSREEFLKFCQLWLSDADFKILSAADISDYIYKDSDLSITKAWKDFDYSLRLELLHARESRRQGLPQKLSHRLSEVFDADNPLELEVNLAALRWRFLEDQEFGFYFDLNFLVIYFFKLQIKERLKLFDKEKGQAIFNQLCEVSYE